MRIWILRHGQAEPSASTDSERSLTQAGRDEVVRMASLLRGQPVDAVLASPYRRAQQTADVVCAAIGFDRGIATVPWLTPDDEPSQCLRFLAERSEGNLLLVSHQPLVSQLVSLLVEGHRRGHYPMPTAGLVCLDTDFVAAGLCRLQYLGNPAEVGRGL